MTSWSGKSKGGKLGYTIFILLLKHTNIRVTYFFVKFVALYFLLVAAKTSSKFYFEKIIGCNSFKTIFSIYKNYNLLGQILIDKISLSMGLNRKFTFDFEGEENLRKIVSDRTGGLLIGAHIGNWEVAGQLLKRLNTKINIVMYEAEHKQIKELLKKNSGEVNATIIPINEDYSHLFQIKEAFENGELVVMHGDRFLPGTNTIVMDFMGKPALFPCGPLYLASKYNVPVSYVYALKYSATHYHFYASTGKSYSYPSKLKTRQQELKQMVQDYIQSLESIIKQYPLQWFNYYPFWEEEKKK